MVALWEITVTERCPEMICRRSSLDPSLQAHAGVLQCALRRASLLISENEARREGRVTLLQMSEQEVVRFAVDFGTAQAFSDRTNAVAPA